MKVITHGKTYHEIECPECKSRFGYTNKETVTVDDQSPFGEDWSTATYVECPECENCITLRLVINGKVVDKGDNIKRFNTGENTPGGLC